jgi:hypothetical protein
MWTPDRAGGSPPPYVPCPRGKTPIFRRSKGRTGNGRRTGDSRVSGPASDRVNFGNNRNQLQGKCSALSVVSRDCGGQRAVAAGTGSVRWHGAIMGRTFRCGWSAPPRWRNVDRRRRVMDGARNPSVPRTEEAEGTREVAGWASQDTVRPATPSPRDFGRVGRNRRIERHKAVFCSWRASPLACSQRPSRSLTPALGGKVGQRQLWPLQT